MDRQHELVFHWECGGSQARRAGNGTGDSACEPYRRLSHFLKVLLLQMQEPFHGAMEVAAGSSEVSAGKIHDGALSFYGLDARCAQLAERPRRSCNFSSISFSTI
jgi:hypothetical protein